MPTLSIIAGGYAGGNVNTANTTQFIRLGGLPVIISNEVLMPITMQSAGKFSNLYVRLSANSCSANTTYSMRDNSVTVNETVRFATAVTGELEDITNSDTIVAGHKYNLTVVPDTGSTGTNTVVICRMLFNTTTATDTATRLVGDDDNGWTASSATAFYTLSGTSAAVSANPEARVRCRQRLAGTMKNYMIDVTANAHTTNGTTNSRINGGNGTLTTSIIASTIGLFEDTSNADSVNPGDDYSTALTVGSDSNIITIRGVAVDFVSTAGYTQCVCANGAGVTTTGAKPVPIAGHLAAIGSETACQMKPGENKQFSQITIGISANTAGSAGTLVFRKNAANGNQTASVTASSTGVFTDPTNLDYVTNSDEVNYQFTPGAAGTTWFFLSSWAKFSPIETVYVEWEEA